MSFSLVFRFFHALLQIPVGGYSKISGSCCILLSSTSYVAESASSSSPQAPTRRGASSATTTTTITTTITCCCCCHTPVNHDVVVSAFPSLRVRCCCCSRPRSANAAATTTTVHEASTSPQHHHHHPRRSGMTVASYSMVLCGSSDDHRYRGRIEKVKFGVPINEAFAHDIPATLLMLLLKVNKDGPAKIKRWEIRNISVRAGGSCCLKMMETRRRSARLQQQTASSLNIQNDSANHKQREPQKKKEKGNRSVANEGATRANNRICSSASKKISSPSSIPKMAPSRVKPMKAKKATKSAVQKIPKSSKGEEFDEMGFEIETEEPQLSNFSNSSAEVGGKNSVEKHLSATRTLKKLQKSKYSVSESSEDEDVSDKNTRKAGSVTKTKTFPKLDENDKKSRHTEIALPIFSENDLKSGTIAKNPSTMTAGPSILRNSPYSKGSTPNTSENEGKSPKIARKSGNVASNFPKQSERSQLLFSRPRRSITTTKKVSYVAKDDLDGIMEISSSSSEDDDVTDSEDDDAYARVKLQKYGNSTENSPKIGEKREKSMTSSNVPPKKRPKAYKISSESSSEDSYESDTSEVSSNSDFDSSKRAGPSNRAEQSRNSRGKRGYSLKIRSKTAKNGSEAPDPHWPKCSKASIAKKTGNPKSSSTKPLKSSLRMAQKQKPAQPWKKNLQSYEEDRKMAKGERRMKEYRVVAHAYAVGKIEEVSYEECFKVHENLKKAYMAGRSLLDAIKDPEGIKKTTKVSEHAESSGTLIEKSSESTGSDDDGSSEDEWEEMEDFRPVLDDNIEVSIDHDALDEDESDVQKDWWVIYLRQEVNKKIREAWENTHKVHLLCYLAHLKLVVKTALDESLVPSLMMSQLPSGYLKYAGEIIPIEVMTNLVKWYTDAFRPLNGVVSIAAIEQDLLEGHEARYPETSRLTAMVDAKCYETDLDRATLLFCLLHGLEATVRICVNARTIPRRWDKKQQKELQEEINRFREMSRSRSSTPKESNATTECSNLNSSNTSKPSEDSDTPKKQGPKSAKSSQKLKNVERNYWVEYWQPRERRWICIDPLHKTVDAPLTIHKNAAAPISYVFAIDNRQGICEVSQRYAMDCVKQEFRRRRTNPQWVSWTLSLPPFRANAERKKFEAMQMREDLVKRPLPTVMSEYKNHPLYVLEKDLLKFEAIYPPPSSQKPLGQIRGHNVYPRSTVFTLQGENNWLKLARSVKIGEKPYKMVKARPDLRIPVEDRVDQFLSVYGYWQTEPYRRPALQKGKIPHNSFGNVYMFNENMCPLECVHIKLPGLVAISRRLNLQCVPAVVGWAFDGGWTHPVMDGAIVLQKDAEKFINEWEKLENGRAEREEKARVEKVYENWKKLIKGVLRLAYVRKQFGHQKLKKPKEAEPVAESAGESSNDNMDHIIDNSEQVGPLEGFSLDDFINKRK